MNKFFLLILIGLVIFSMYSCVDFNTRCRQAGGTMMHTRDPICVDAEGRIINGKLRNG